MMGCFMIIGLQIVLFVYLSDKLQCSRFEYFYRIMSKYQFADRNTANHLCLLRVFMTFITIISYIGKAMNLQQMQLKTELTCIF